MTIEEIKVLNAEYVRINRKLEKLWLPKVEAAIKSKVSSLIEKIRQDGTDAGLRYLSVDIGNFKLTGVIQDLYREVGLIHARRAEKRLRAIVGKSYAAISETKRLGTSEIWVKFIEDYLRMFLIEKITFKVNQTTRDTLLDFLNQAIKDGLGVDEIVKRLSVLPFTAYQAARIVRTEINRASNVGTQAQGESFEYQLVKIWLSVRDNRTRGINPKDHADHYGLNGQTVDFEDVFRDPRNGHELQHPGDPEAEAEDVINCRCQFASEPKRNERGRLIPKIAMAA